MLSDSYSILDFWESKKEVICSDVYKFDEVWCWGGVGFFFGDFFFRYGKDAGAVSKGDTTASGGAVAEVGASIGALYTKAASFI